MKKYILIALVALSSCRESNVKKESTGLILNTGSEPLEIVTIDGCEYLYGPWGKETVLTHKGNCKFCRQRKN